MELGGGVIRETCEIVDGYSKSVCDEHGCAQLRATLGILLHVWDEVRGFKTGAPAKLGTIDALSVQHGLKSFSEGHSNHLATIVTVFTFFLNIGID